ncbi:MAG: TM0996/MTH895 family glutaredoxin-like protein [Bacteroidaceae bacterium]|nr:TM0996/MTH895 family glutaredoxin-like protein [Bacteroidaceae bacterium]
MEIKILGTGCGKCKTTYALIEKVVKENNITATIAKVEDIMEIMNYNILATPAVVVDGEVKVKGYVPSEKQIKELLGL